MSKLLFLNTILILFLTNIFCIFFEFFFFDVSIPYAFRPYSLGFDIFDVNIPYAFRPYSLPIFDVNIFDVSALPHNYV